MPIEGDFGAVEHASIYAKNLGWGLTQQRQY